MDIFNILTSNDDYNAMTLNRHLCSYLETSMSCLRMTSPLASVPTSNQSGYCPQMWSVVNCYPRTPFNTTFAAPCASNFGTTTQVGETNSPKGIIAMHCNATLGGWNERSSLHTCFNRSSDMDDDISSISNVTLPPDYTYDMSNDYYSDDDTKVDDYNARYEILTRYVTVGHALSLATLLVALALLACLKNIHCTRIYIHMNLMAAFMFRGLIWILHSAAFRDPDMQGEQADRAIMELSSKLFQRHFAEDLPKLEDWKTKYCDIEFETDYNWCRLYNVFQIYFVTANYFWLLVEGLYLRLLLRAVLFSHTKYMRAFLVLGWGLPWLPVVAYFVPKSLDPEENRDCWYEDRNSAYWWIVKVPILISLLINFMIFVNVVCVVGAKLRVNQRQQADDRREDYKWRLTKSTLSLIPLLGTQYLITAFVHFDQEENPTAEFVKKAFEVSFVSIQGLLVAFIYCFFNGEVQEECGKTWRRWKTRWELERRERKHHRMQRRRSMNHSSITNLFTSVVTRKSSLYTDVSAVHNGDVHYGAMRVNNETVSGRHTSSNSSYVRPPVSGAKETRYLTNGRANGGEIYIQMKQLNSMKETDITDQQTKNNVVANGEQSGADQPLLRHNGKSLQLSENNDNRKSSIV
ncbi:vasoactive intestinal polypeptide receptor 1-like [Ciona intestinalis]